jgi:hypothetical protein
MVNSCAIREPMAEVPGLDSAFEAAVGLWALIEAAESMPASTETQSQLAGARRALGAQLDRLGWDEELLRQSLMEAPLLPGKPPDLGPLSSCS